MLQIIKTINSRQMCNNLLLMSGQFIAGKEAKVPFSWSTSFLLLLCNWTYCRLLFFDFSVLLNTPQGFSRHSIVSSYCTATSPKHRTPQRTNGNNWYSFSKSLSTHSEAHSFPVLQEICSKVFPSFIKKSEVLWSPLVTKTIYISIGKTSSPKLQTLFSPTPTSRLLQAQRASLGSASCFLQFISQCFLQWGLFISSAEIVLLETVFCSSWSSSNLPSQ